MTSNQQILSDLHLIMETDQEIELLSTYKGVPFICKARIKNMDGDAVHLEAHDPAIICLRNSGQARVLGSEYFEPALAQVMSFDIVTGAIELSNFSYVGTKLGERMIVRVEPKTPIEVLIQNEGQNVVGSMIDLSLNGIGLRVGYTDYNATLKPGTNIQLKMKLPNGKIEVPGAVLSVTKTPNYYRLSIRFTQSGPEKATLLKYLIERRAEIEQELQQDYEAALHPKAAKK